MTFQQYLIWKAIQESENDFVNNSFTRKKAKNPYLTLKRRQKLKLEDRNKKIEKGGIAKVWCNSCRELQIE